jgi:hypothetical protein
MHQTLRCASPEVVGDSEHSLKTPATFWKNGWHLALLTIEIPVGQVVALRKPERTSAKRMGLRQRIEPAFFRFVTRLRPNN